jgi:oligoribonuclease
MTSKNLLWIDLECTHLDKDCGLILEIAAVVTDSHLNCLDKGIHLVLHYSKQVLEESKVISEWSENMHSKGSPSLWELVAQSTTSPAQAETELGQYMDKHRQNKRLMLAGSSVHFDLNYLRQHMPSLRDSLHYRVVDVSSVLELYKRWYPRESHKLPLRPSNHRAMGDIYSSIHLLKYFRSAIFRSSVMYVPIASTPAFVPSIYKYVAK